MIDISDTTKCCGCGACKSACPVNAINMCEDRDGYIFPEIDRDKCIDCGKCNLVCQYINTVKKNKAIRVYAASTADRVQIMKSASGGAFGAIASAFLKEGGCVYGAAMFIADNVAAVRHVPVESEKELDRIRGSKYVQSDIQECFSDIQRRLNDREKVLFSGTPCEVAAVKNYLQKEYDNLYTVDILCHGVPGLSIFNRYLNFLAKRKKIEISDYIFRDKERGNGFKAKCLSTRKKWLKLWTYQYMYMYLYKNSRIDRNSCSMCPYSAWERVGDVSVGDFWGIDECHPEYMIKNGGELDGRKGISLVLENTEKGRAILDAADLTRYECTMEDALFRGDALKYPQKQAEDRNKILELMRNGGYDSVYKYCRKKMGLLYYKLWIAENIFGIQ